MPRMMSTGKGSVAREPAEIALSVSATSSRRRPVQLRIASNEFGCTSAARITDESVCKSDEMRVAEKLDHLGEAESR